MQRFALSMLVLLAALSPIYADGLKGPEDVRLKGRGAGRGIAFFWNHTDNTTRRAIAIGGTLAVAGAIAFGIRRFVVETKSAISDKPKQPWNDLT